MYNGGRVPIILSRHLLERKFATPTNIAVTGVIFLTWIDMTQCVHLLDATTSRQGELQVRSKVMVWYRPSSDISVPWLRDAVRLGVLHGGFERNTELNGLVHS